MRSVSLRPASFTADYDGDGNTTEGLEQEIAGLETILYAQIQLYAKNVIGTWIGYYGATNPYWFKDNNHNGVIDASEATNANQYKSFDAKLLKAAYNYQTVYKEPNAGIHNPTYTMEFLYDSIQDIGGNVSTLTRP